MPPSGKEKTLERAIPPPSSRRSPICFAALLAAAALLAPAVNAQRERAQEIVANLAAGRVVVAVAKDGIVVGSLENPIEPDTSPPEIVPLSSQRAGVVLGAFDWWLPETHRELARLDKELPELPALASGGEQPPSLQPGAEAGAEASDIESFGKGFQKRLNQVAQNIHGNLGISSREPLAELLLADYLEGYGPEVWLIRVGIGQEPLEGHYWQSRALPPHYSQLWPPEKGQPRTLVEVDYPAAPSAPSLLDLLRQQDPRLARVAAASPRMASVSQAVLRGELKRERADDVAAFLHRCFAALAAPGARQEMAIVAEKEGFAWVIRAPQEPSKPGAEQLRPPGAPTLHRPPRKP